jgi:hypothetical protein
MSHVVVVIPPLGTSQKTVVSPVAKGVGVTVEVRLPEVDLDLLHLTSCCVWGCEPKCMLGPNLLRPGSLWDGCYYGSQLNLVVVEPAESTPP